jgi:hypothetical protein
MGSPAPAALRLSVLALGALLLPRPASALAISLDFELAYDARIVESDVPGLPVGALVPGNLIDVDETSEIAAGAHGVGTGSWVLAGLLSFDLAGAVLREDSGGWSLEHAVACNPCALLFGEIPSDATDISAYTVIEILPGDSDGHPPDPFASGMQTLVFVADPGFTIGTVVAELVPAPPTALAVALAAAALARRRRR